MARGRWLVIWAAGTAIITVVGFLLGTQIRSPWDRAIANADAERIVTAKVEHRSLATGTAAISGVLSLGSESTVSIPLGDAPAIVTDSFVRSGDEVTSGDLIAEVSGKAVVALNLPFRLYRDLVPGSTGPDVAALQEALIDLGLLAGVADGDYGVATASAVERLFSIAGAEPPAPSADAVASVTAARSTLQELQDAQDAGPEELADAREKLRMVEFAALTPLPAHMVAIIPSGRSVVLSSVGVGADLGETGQLINLRNGHPRVVFRVAVDQAELFPDGMKVMVTSVADTSLQTTGIVRNVSAYRPGGDGEVPGYDVSVRVDSAKELTDGLEVLVAADGQDRTIEGTSVPLVAIREDADGTYVLRPSEATPSPERVEVRILQTGDGYAIVSSAELRVSDEVIVSR